MLPGLRHLVQWCVVPSEMYIGFGLSAVSVIFGSFGYVDWPLAAGVALYGSTLTGYRNYVLSHTPELKQGIPRWWRWLWRAVIIANIVVYFLHANMR